MIRKLLTNSLLFLIVFTYKTYGKEEELKIKQKENSIEILNFKDGDEIHMFDFKSGDHILTKTRNVIDFTQLPDGEYIIIDNKNRIAVLEKTPTQLHSLVFSREVSKIAKEYVINFEEQNQKFDARDIYIEEGKKSLVVENFEYGDKIKLFQAKDSTHVLTKTYSVIDFDFLDDGTYYLEKNNNGNKVYLEKSNGNLRLTDNAILTSSL